MTKHYIVVLGASVVSLAAGGVGGYFYATKVLEERYAEQASREIKEAKAYFHVLYKGEGLETPAEAVRTLIDPESATPERLEEVIAGLKALDDYKPPADDEKPQPRFARKDVSQEEIVTEHRTQPPKEFTDYRAHVIKKIEERVDEEQGDQKGDEEVAKVQNVFDQEPPAVPNFRDEPRMPGKPYMISEEEFYEGEKNYMQSTLTYYSGDGVLTDDKDEIIAPEYVGTTVGPFLERFGETSSDPNTLHVRNDDLTLDFEIIKDESRYAEKVAGFEGSDG